MYKGMEGMWSFWIEILSASLRLLRLMTITECLQWNYVVCELWKAEKGENYEKMKRGEE